MADTPAEIKKAFKLYLLIGGVLFIGTVLTVAVAYVPALDFGAHGFDKADAIIGFTIAATKATLVALIFMHLNHEKKPIYWIFIGSLFFGVALILLFAFSFMDPITFNGLMPTAIGK